MLWDAIPETNSSPLKIGRAPKGKETSLPVPSMFRGDLLVVGSLLHDDAHVSHNTTISTSSPVKTPDIHSLSKAIVIHALKLA